MSTAPDTEPKDPKIRELAAIAYAVIIAQHFNIELDEEMDLYAKLKAVWDHIEASKAASSADKVRLSTWVDDRAATIDHVTRSVGSSIDGFRFEHRESSFGTPGEIEVFGTTDQDRHFNVNLRITDIVEVDNDDLI